ncbi:hypothetical protein CPLU01_15321 [Colletotrichum plurivorum]|uniref:Uncharacterized protein n=1 Tax=Colletotrichum plurivorum TaxID=2175906 RepID=A0A8H6MVD8_9PEZI|nr:hypothetical protein CPLU01_15321 [Colletotrichum plurivorum]
MASQPPVDAGPQPASPTGPDRGSGPPPGPSLTSRAKRRRDTEAQPLRPSLVGSQPNTPATAPLMAKGPSNASGTATGSILAAFDEQTRLYEARMDVFLTIARSVDNVVSSFEGPKKQIAKEATTYVIQALKRLMNNEATSTSNRKWATVAAAASTAAPVAAPAQNQTPTRSQAQTQPEDLRVFARIPEESLTAARKHAPFALRQTVCQALGLQLADIPHIYHITTGYSLKPRNKEVQQSFLNNKQKLADCLGAFRTETPTKWFTYAIPRCPFRLQSLDGDSIDVSSLIEDEIIAQTGHKPVLARQSRLGPNLATNEITGVVSFPTEVSPFRLFNQSSKAQLIQKKGTLARHNPGCQGYHRNRYCNRRALCNNCGGPSDSHETRLCPAKPKCANCSGPFQAGHADCPARPILVNGHPTLPGRKERTRIRKAGQKAYDALYGTNQSNVTESGTQQSEGSLPPGQGQQPGSKRPRTRTPSQSSIVCRGDGDTASGVDEDDTMDSEALPQTNRPIRPIHSRSQRVAQKPDYNVANAYNYLDLDSET